MLLNKFHGCLRLTQELYHPMQADFIAAAIAEDVHLQNGGIIKSNTSRCAAAQKFPNQPETGIRIPTIIQPHGLVAVRDKVYEFAICTARGLSC